MSRIGVGFVGLGWMGTTLLHRLAEREDVQVRWVCSSNPRRARDTLMEMGLSAVEVTDDFDTLLKSPGVDAVFLAGPNADHGPQAIAALEAGRHVFCEKPSAITFQEHRRQIDLARAHPELRTFIDYILYFDTFEQRLRQMIADDALGRITQIQVNYRHAINAAGTKAWKLNRAVMGDAIGMGINHALSVMVTAMASQARPVSVTATSMPAQVRPFEADPIWNIHVRFDNGATGTVLGNIDSHNGYDAYHNIAGTRGGVVFDSLLPRAQKVRCWQVDQADGHWVYPLDPAACEKQGVRPWPAETTTPDSGDVIHHQTDACVEHFIESVKQGHPSPLSFDQAADIGEIGWAAQISALEGRAVDLPVDHALAGRVFGLG